MKLAILSALLCCVLSYCALSARSAVKPSMGYRLVLVTNQLEAATSPAGPWTNVAGCQSIWMLSVPMEGTIMFRAVLQGSSHFETP